METQEITTPAFPDFEFPPEVARLLLEPGSTWVDSSYHHDAMPSVVNEDLDVRLFINWPTEHMRYEADSPNKYYLYGGSDGSVLYQGDSWVHVLEQLAERRS